MEVQGINNTDLNKKESTEVKSNNNPSGLSEKKVVGNKNGNELLIKSEPEKLKEVPIEMAQLRVNQIISNLDSFYSAYTKARSSMTGDDANLVNSEYEKIISDFKEFNNMEVMGSIDGRKKPEVSILSGEEYNRLMELADRANEMKIGMMKRVPRGNGGDGVDGNFVENRVGDNDNVIDFGEERRKSGLSSETSSNKRNEESERFVEKDNQIKMHERALSFAVKRLLEYRMNEMTARERSANWAKFAEDIKKSVDYGESRNFALRMFSEVNSKIVSAVSSLAQAYFNLKARYFERKYSSGLAKASGEDKNILQNAWNLDSVEEKAEAVETEGINDKTSFTLTKDEFNQLYSGDRGSKIDFAKNKGLPMDSIVRVVVEGEKMLIDTSTANGKLDNGGQEDNFGVRVMIEAQDENFKNKHRNDIDWAEGRDKTQKTSEQNKKVSEEGLVYESETYSEGKEDSENPARKNQDGVLSRDDKGVYVVCDGVGGHSFGEKASGLAVEVINKECENLPQEAMSIEQAQVFVRSVVEKANGAILAEIMKDSNDGKQNNMASTLTIAIVCKGTDGKQKVVIGQIGDSRAAIYNNNKFEQITVDQDYIDKNVKDKRHALELQQMFNNVKDEGDIYRLSNLSEDDKFLLQQKLKGFTGGISNRDAIYGNLGKEGVEPVISVHDFESGAKLYLYSDGLSDGLYDREIEERLNKGGGIRELAAGAKESGRKPDDISVIELKRGRKDDEYKKAE